MSLNDISFENFFEAQQGSNFTGIAGYTFELENFSFSDTLDFLQNENKEFFYWSKPDEKIKFAAFSPILVTKSDNKDRFETLRNFYAEIVDSYITNSSIEFRKIIPLLVGGIGFFDEENSSVWEDFHSMEFFVPRFLFMYLNGKIYFTINFTPSIENREQVENKMSEVLTKLKSSHKKAAKNNSLIEQAISQHSPLEKWERKINLILKGIQSGEVDKVVLSRSLEFKLAEEPLISDLMKSLNSRYPKCFNFVFSSGRSIFFGASPERLFKLSGDWVEADALAGSAPIGRTKTEDEKFIMEDLFSSKNQAEHASVVKYLKKSLELFSEKIIFNSNPFVKKLESIQHLWTPIKAKLKPGSSIVSVLEVLHPTPAVCGLPSETAKKIISDLEDHKRGLFAGGIGWLNSAGEGEFTVAIRSALLKKNSIYLFAGSGIVDGSQPVSEFEETELKFKPIIKLFGNGKNKS